MVNVILLVWIMGCDTPPPSDTESADTESADTESSDTDPSDEGEEEVDERVAFSCGELTCQPGEYCIFGSNPVMSPDTAEVSDVLYSCERIPASCADAPSCSCLEEEVDPSVTGGCEAGCEERDGGLFCETELS